MACIALSCCTCGEKKDIEVTREPSFGFEFYKIVEEAGWTPALDLNYGRTLCFCSESCKQKQITKGGYIRKRLIHAEKAE